MTESVVTVSGRPQITFPQAVLEKKKAPKSFFRLQLLMRGVGDNPTVTGADEGFLKAVLEAFNRHDLDTIMSFLTEDCALDMPRGPNPFGSRYQGKASVREGLATRFSGIPNVHYGNDRHFVSKSGDRGVSEWLLTGTSTSGDRIEVRGCDLFELTQEGKIRRKDSYWKIVQR